MNHLCSECGLQIFKQSYKEHLALHKEEKFICDLCGKMFCTTGRLKGHQLVYHGKEIYSCDKCNKIFGKKYHLSRHSRRENCETKDVQEKQQKKVQSLKLNKMNGIQIVVKTYLPPNIPLLYT